MYMRCVCIALLMATLCASLGAADTPYPDSFYQPQQDERPMLGIYMGGAGDEGGVTIRSVIPGTAAAGMGLQPGDVITTLNGQDITSTIDLYRTVQSQDVGSDVSVTVLRNGAEHQYEGSFGKWPDHIPGKDWGKRLKDRARRNKNRKPGFFSRMADAIKKQKELEQALAGKPIQTDFADEPLRSPLMHAATAAELLGKQAWTFSFLVDVDAAELQQADVPSGTTVTERDKAIEMAPDFRIDCYYSPSAIDL